MSLLEETDRLFERSSYWYPRGICTFSFKHVKKKECKAGRDPQILWRRWVLRARSWGRRAPSDALLRVAVHFRMVFAALLGCSGDLVRRRIMENHMGLSKEAIGGY